jgi:hypothetical protein
MTEFNVKVYDTLKKYLGYLLLNYIYATNVCMIKITHAHFLYKDYLQTKLCIKVPRHL